MFRLRSKSGDESVFRTPEEIRAALLSGFVTPDAQIWDAELKGWVPLLEHALYQQIAATPGGRKSNAVKAPPASPTTAKPVQKLVIRRPGEAAPPASPPPPPPPAPKPPVVEETPEFEMLDIDLSMEPEPTPAQAPTPEPPVAAQPPKRPTPPPAPPAPPQPPPPPPPRVSAPTVPPTAPAPRASASRPVAEPTPVFRSMAPVEEGGSKKGLLIAAVVVLALGGGAFAMLRGKGADVAALPDSTALAAAAAPVSAADSAPDSTTRAAVDSATPDSAAAVPVAATVDSAKPVAVDTASAAPAAPAVAGVPFGPPLERGFTSWNARPATPQPLSVPELEAVRLRYVATQARALEEFEAGLEAIGFADMFNPSRVGRQDRREEAVETVDAGRDALQTFRRRQAAIDFAYTDTLRAALPAGSDTPDLRTFGPVLRESPAQAALTDSLLTGMSDLYTLLVNTPGGFTLRGRDLVFKDAAKGDEYRVMVERLTAQLGRIRSRPGSEIPPAMGGILRGIGLPR